MRTYGVIRELAPTTEQAAMFQRIVGANRYAQNWAVQYVRDCLDLGLPVEWSFYSLRKQFNAVKAQVCIDKETGERWDLEVPERALRSGIERAAKSLKNFSDSKRGKRGGARVGFPRRRSRGQRDSAAFPDPPKKEAGKVYLRKVGWVALKEDFTVPDGARLTGCVLRERAGKWFVTLLVREDTWTEPSKKPIRSAVGVDLGVGDHFAILSDGTKIDNPRFFRTDERLIKRRNKQVSRTKKGSANRRKAVQRLARTHYRVSNRRKDFLHKLSTNMVETQDLIVIEDLSVAGMARSGLRLGKSVHDAAMSEFRRQLKYKSEWYGTTLLTVDRWFPSSKNCSACGVKNAELRLEQFWVCSACGVLHERNENAAENILVEGLRLAEIERPEVLRSLPVEAGEDASQEAHRPVKQEERFVRSATMIALNQKRSF